MILKCQCGRTATAQPYRSSVVQVWLCDNCKKELSVSGDGDKMVRILQHHASPRGGTGRRKGLKIPRG